MNCDVSLAKMTSSESSSLSCSMSKFSAKSHSSEVLVTLRSRFSDFVADAMLSPSKLIVKVETVKIVRQQQRLNKERPDEWVDQKPSAALRDKLKSRSLMGREISQ